MKRVVNSSPDRGCTANRPEHGGPLVNIVMEAAYLSQLNKKTNFDPKLKAFGISTRFSTAVDLAVKKVETEVSATDWISKLVSSTDHLAVQGKDRSTFPKRIRFWFGLKLLREREGSNDETETGYL